MKWTRLTMSGQTEWCMLPHRTNRERGQGEGRRRGEVGRGEGLKTCGSGVMSLSS